MYSIREQPDKENIEFQMNHYSYKENALSYHRHSDININDISLNSLSSLNNSPKCLKNNLSTSTIDDNDYDISFNKSTILEELECELPVVPLTSLELEILHNFKVNENKYPIDTNYLTTVQSEINQSMRSILCDWLVEVSEEYNLTPQTFNLTINYIDRFLSAIKIAREHLQLVGVTCMLLASKFEEINPPAIDDFVYISDNTYQRQEVSAMETHVLKALSFSVSVVTPFNFIEYYVSVALANLRSDMCNFHEAFDYLAKYISELGMIESVYYHYSPSMYAMSCVVLALFVLHSPSWSEELEIASGYSFDDLNACVFSLHKLVSANQTKTKRAVYSKYAQEQYFYVSTLTIPALE